MTRDNSNKGQAFTLEGFFSAIIVLSAVVFALSSTVITPLSSSTSSEEIQNTEGARAQAVLEASKNDGSLKRAVLAYNTSANCYGNASTGVCLGPAEKENVTGKFGERLRETFGDRAAVNVQVIPYKDGGSRALLNQGTPSENAQSYSVQLFLSENDSIHMDNDGDGRLEPVGPRLNNTTFGPAPMNRDSEQVDVVTVRVKVWRI